MSETEAQLAALVHEAKEHPGRVVEGFAPADRDHLRKSAEKHRREAARLDAAARDTFGGDAA